MQGYKRKITKRYYNYEKWDYAYSVWIQAVITNDIDRFQAKKHKKWQLLDGDLFDWYEFIQNGTGENYINVEKVYEWEVYADEQSGIL